MSDPASLRVADADRERLAAELREHMVAGRLNPDEFEERLGMAYAATTRADLDALRVDLPMSPAGLRLALTQRRTELRGRLLQEASGSLIGSGVCVAIWLASGASGSFWPIWVILFSLLPVVRGLWQLYGPAPDHEALEAQLKSRRERDLARERHRSRAYSGRRHKHRGLPR